MPLQLTDCNPPVSPCPMYCAQCNRGCKGVHSSHHELLIEHLGTHRVESIQTRPHCVRHVDLRTGSERVRVAYDPIFQEPAQGVRFHLRSEEHTSELQS